MRALFPFTRAQQFFYKSNHPPLFFFPNLSFFQSILLSSLFLHQFGSWKKEGYKRQHRACITSQLNKQSKAFSQTHKVCMQMGNQNMYEYDPKHHLNLKPKVMINKNRMKRSVKITYISSPLLVRECDASEFRSVVQQLTGKDSNTNTNTNNNTNNSVHHHHHHHQQSNLQKDPATLMHCKAAPLVPSPISSVMQSGEEDWFNCGGSFYDNNNNNNRSMMNSLELDEDYFWKDVALSVLQSSSVFAIAWVCMYISIIIYGLILLFIYTCNFKVWFSAIFRIVRSMELWRMNIEYEYEPIQF